jgi:hypothetical protein
MSNTATTSHSHRLVPVERGAARLALEVGVVITDDILKIPVMSVTLSRQQRHGGSGIKRCDRRLP